MRLTFLDTSALAKYYRRESGSSFIERLFADSNSQRVISRLTLVEMESVFALKVRAREIAPETTLMARRRLESDLGQRRILVASVRDEHFQIARMLVAKQGHDLGLRALDALQLSVAVGLKRAGFAPVFVVADQKLCRIAEVEGFRVANPEQPATILI